MSPPLVAVCVVSGAAGAALLVAPPGPTSRPGRGRVAGSGWAVALVGLLVVLSVGAPTLALLRARVLGVGAIAALTAYGALLLVRRRRRRREVAVGQTRVLDFCQLLAAELAAGQPSTSALGRAAGDWPELRPVLAASRLGSDLPGALREVSRRPGHGDLVLVAAAWQVAHVSGGGLAHAVGRVAAGIRAAQGTRRVVQAELASARATARLMAGLPVLALLMGGGLGGNPVAFLLGTGWGLACLAGGLALGFVGLWWIEAVADAVAREGW